MTETVSRTLLLIEAEPPPEQTVKRALEQNGYACVWEHDGDLEPVLKRESNGLSLLDAVCFVSLPHWSHQIGAVRLQTNQVIVDMAARFGTVAEALGGAISTPSHGAFPARGQGELTVIAESQRELSGLTETLRSLQGGQNAVVEELSGLSGYTSELSDMANQMTSIARHTKKLALNSAVQAAHAGQNGAGLAVIAHEVHLLSVYTAETSEHMGRVAKTLSEAIDSSSRLSEDLAQKDKEAVAQIDGTVERVLGDFHRITRQLTDLTQVLQHTNSHVQSEVMEVLVALQFEDRINQILASVVGTLNELHGLIGQNGHAGLTELGGAQGWLDRMAGTYTTQEQHHNHHGAPAAASDDMDITFF
jgi:methyl-accepting chemotaxis protein